jgi:hypothetical protein
MTCPPPTPGPHPAPAPSPPLRLCVAQLVWTHKQPVVSARARAHDEDDELELLNLKLRVWSMDVAQCAVECEPTLLCALTVLPAPVACSTSDDGSGECRAPSVVATGSGGLALAWAVGPVDHVFAATATVVGSSLRLRAGPGSVGVGTAPALAFAPTTGPNASHGALLLLSANGFCQNNEAQNKAAAPPGVCGIRAPHGRGTVGVLVASYGRLLDFEVMLLRNETMNACDPLMMHGAYDQVGTSMPCLLDPWIDCIRPYVVLYRLIIRTCTYNSCIRLCAAI